MIIELNGRELELPDGATVADAARAAGIEPERRGVAIALDGEVVPGGRLDATRLDAGQRVEVVEAIGGGAR
jgi:sulfur carrier protein